MQLFKYENIVSKEYRARRRRLDFKNQKTTKPIEFNESWEMLVENKFSSISIGYFGSPNEFYVENLCDIKK